MIGVTDTLPFSSYVDVNCISPIDFMFSVFTTFPPISLFPMLVVIGGVPTTGVTITGATTVCTGSSSPSRVAYFCSYEYGTEGDCCATDVDKGIFSTDLFDPSGFTCESR